MSNIPQTGTPSTAGLATTLVTSAAITGAAFALGKPADFSTVVDVAKQVTSKHPIENRRIIYGTRGQLGGTLTYVTTSPTTTVQHALGVPVSDNGNIHMVLTFAGHEIDGFLGGSAIDERSHTATVPLIIYLDGFAVPLTLNGAPAFGGDSTSYVDIFGLPMAFSAAPTDGAYYVPTDYMPPRQANGSHDKAHDFRWRIRVEIDNGVASDTSQPFPLLASDTSSGNPGSWTSHCLQRGCAKAHVQLVWDKDRFNNGLPNISFSIAGKKVYDPRLSPPGYAYSTNAALCLYDYMTDTKVGLGVDPSRIDQTLFIAAANKCDEDMALREGGTQKRYACNGVVDAKMKRGDVIQKLLDAMAGTLVPPGDVWKMYAGGYSDPVLTITDSDLRGPIKLDSAVSRKDLVNGAKGTFISPDNGWQAADYPPYVNATYFEDDGGTIVTVDGHPTYPGATFSDFSLDFVTDSVQAQRLAKIKIEKIRHNHPLVLQCKMMAFPVEVNDTISFTHARFGLSAATYVVTNTALVYDDKSGAPTLGYDLVCVPAVPEDYAWDPDVDEGTVVICTAPLLPDNTNVGPPTGVGSPPVLGLLSDDTTSIIRADGIAHSQIKVTWTPPTDHNVLNGGYIEIFIKAVGDPTFLLAGTAAGTDDTFFISSNITDGVAYDVMIQSLNAAGSHSVGLSGTVVCSGAASTIAGSGAGPVGVVNNDFEASDTLPPTGWKKKGSPTLDFEISSQQQGLRSLKITSSVQYEGVYSAAKYAVVPGDMFTGEQYKVGGYIKGDSIGHGAIVFRFFNASDVEVGTPVVADGGNPTPASWNFYSAVGPVDNAAVYARVFCQNLTTSGTSNLLEFDSIVLFRVASMEDEIVNGPTRGAITAANSSYRPLTNPLTAVYDGLSGSPPAQHCEIDIAAFTMRSAIGPTDIPVNSGVLAGLDPLTTYHVYYDDPTYAGGAVTYFCNIDQAIALDATGRFYVGSIQTPAVGGLPTVGNNDGGTGAQSGQLYLLSPTLRNDLDVAGEQPETWYPASFADTNGDTTDYFTLSDADRVCLGGWPQIYTKWTSLKLKIHSQVDSVTAGGSAFLEYSLDDNLTWHDIYNVVYGSDDAETAGAGANDSSAGTAWTNPGNMTSDNDWTTISGAAHGTTSKNVKATDFGFAIPSGSTIDGITVTFDEQDGGTAEDADPSKPVKFQVQMLKAGVPYGTAKTVDGLITTGQTISPLGDNTDLWGGTWADTDINNINFGFEIKAITPKALDAWAADTYYSPMALIKDSNGNFQVCLVPGTTGSTHPTWSAGSLGSTTAEGPDTLVWALYQKTGLTWSAGQTWNPGDPSVPPNGTLANGDINTPHFITANAAGTNCVFELTKGRMPRVSVDHVFVWIESDPQGGGSYDKLSNMGNPPACDFTHVDIQSLHWSSQIVGTNIEEYVSWSSTDFFHWWDINGDGSMGSSFDMGNLNQWWEAACIGTLQFPEPGIYTFKLMHDDGCMVAFDPVGDATTYGSASFYSGASVINDYISKSSVYNFPWMVGTNEDPPYASDHGTPYDVWDQQFSIKVAAPTKWDKVSPISVKFEIGYKNSVHKGHMILQCQDSAGVFQEIVPVSKTLKTGPTTPAWPAWSLSHAGVVGGVVSGWPTVTDAGGNFIWVNRGPATDFAWPHDTFIEAAGTPVIGSNGYTEFPYRAGESNATTEPTWLTTVNTKLMDGSSLTWVNTGAHTAATFFDFGVRNAVIDVAYLPPGAINTRAAFTDEVTLPLSQNLNKVQVRYGLQVGGQMKVYEVWIEAVAG